MSILRLVLYDDVNKVILSLDLGITLLSNYKVWEKLYAHRSSNQLLLGR